MAESCPHLDYRVTAGDSGPTFDHERPYCTVVNEFVQPMRADVCNARHDLDPTTHCEFYRDEHDLPPVTGFEAATD